MEESLLLWDMRLSGLNEMAVRIRADRKTIVCAAESKPRPGDCYLDDDVHHTLSVELGILCCIGQDKEGADLWEFCSPGTLPSYCWRKEEDKMGSDASLQTQEGLLEIKASDPPFTHVLAIVVTADAGKESERVVSLRCRELAAEWEPYDPRGDEAPAAVEMLLSFPETTVAKLAEGFRLALYQLALAWPPRGRIKVHDEL